ncbi:MAG: hypothetical protein KDC70_13720 [Saprospiraceae bacterium]|nr:hypothetical protein [Saprospiraceae bacterium]
MNTRLICAFVAALFIIGCKKDPAPPPITPETPFSVTVNNEYGPLQARLAIFLSGEDGETLVYRELPGHATTVVEAPNSGTDDRFDCTVAKIVAIDAPGSGVRDTIVTLTTYTSLQHGETINLRNIFPYLTTDLNVHFTNVTSVDTVIVPDGLTFEQPQASNNFNGRYRVQHTGKIWLRARVNGQQMWRFILFDKVSEPQLDATLDAAVMLPIFAAPKNIALPFTAAWEYKVDGIVDTSGFQFLALGDLLRAPGGAVPVFSDVDIYEPITNDVFDPGPKPYSGFRVRLSGADPNPGGYTYYSDDFYADIPATAPVPAFDLQPTTLSDNRLVATQCIGNFDALVFSRTRPGTPNIGWEVYTAPASGVVAYRLPDVPDALGNEFPALKNYDFGGNVRARAEEYKKISAYETVLRHLLQNDDPLWRAKAGYLGREEAQ